MLKRAKDNPNINQSIDADFEQAKKHLAQSLSKCFALTSWSGIASAIETADNYFSDKDTESIVNKCLSLQILHAYIELAFEDASEYLKE